MPNTTIAIWLYHNTPHMFPTPWAQYHCYGVPVAGGFRGSQGITAFISPSLNLPISPLFLPSQYCLGLQVGPYQLVCVYFPPCLPDESVISFLSSLPLTPATILCGDFNARLGPHTGDYVHNTHGHAFFE
ncbi:hypothetical protein BJ085DRAFT_14393 [Dimargaris cristalligena]|uniref:Endonuclease/exonuclease/phosphatase domain-containing protein n=1 Tax=Dimargaris cristalligena TaxID=215637 RepID=A0A4P9ZL13_9FUNG|nr:hypothetical protein BJ085DRAFT_14393 [Dimargaris cristalligena]|eukprot:RKP33161.1 hypothetical protein BJ085DRAFT_14393 [Dimargaris cristalligena]